MATMHPHLVPGTVDLFILEYAVNARPDCAESIPWLTRLVHRVKSEQPSAAVLFLNAWSITNTRTRDDASSCVEAVGAALNVTVVSWRSALSPLYSANPSMHGYFHDIHGSLRPVHHHPNIEGHGQMAALVLHALLGTPEVSLARGWQPAQPEPRLVESARAQVVHNAHSKCLRAHNLRDAATLNRGWAYPKGSKSLLSASVRGATLEIPYSCAASSCSLALGVVTSYQPLGTIDVFVNGRRVLSNYSEADPDLEKQFGRVTVGKHIQLCGQCGNDGLYSGHGRCPNMAKLRLPAPDARVGTSGHVRAGNVTIVCRGSTIPLMARLPSNYSKHQVLLLDLIISDGAGCPKVARERLVASVISFVNDGWN